MDPKIQQIMDQLALKPVQAHHHLAQRVEILRSHPVRSVNWLK